MRSGFGWLFAITTYVLPPASKFTNQIPKYGSLSEMLNTAFQTAIAVGAALAMFRIAYAGWLYMGSDMWSNKNKAKEVFQNALMGLFLLLGVYLILDQIDPHILSLKIKIMAPTEQAIR